MVPPGTVWDHLRLAAPDEMTFARRDGRYRVQVVRGTFEHCGDEVNEALARQSTFEWPYAFARLRASAEQFLSRFGANHIRAIPGDHLAELAEVCRLLDVDFARWPPDAG